MDTFFIKNNPMNREIMRCPHVPLILLLCLFFFFGSLGPLHAPTAYAGWGEDKAPASVRESLEMGLPQDVIILYAHDDIQQSARVRQREKEINSDDEEIGEFRAAAYAKRRKEVFSRLPESQYTPLEAYERLPLDFVRLKSDSVLSELADDPYVKGIYPNKARKMLLSESLPFIGQPEAEALGHTGAGTMVVVIDSGVDYTRTAFGSCTSPGQPADCRVVYADDLTDFDDGTLDDSGHGTNVAGIVLGVAPDAEIAALDVFNGSTAYDNVILKGIDWAMANRTTYNIVAVNLSLGSDSNLASCPNSVYAQSFDLAREAGIVPVVSAGNEMMTNALSEPACVPGAVSVGAVYDHNIGTVYWDGCTDRTSAADMVACISNSASTLTILAPGVNISTAGQEKSGTSMAAPHVAGAVALIKGDTALPDATVGQTVTRLTASGKSVRDSRNGLTFPRLDVGAALEDLVDSDGDGTTDTVDNCPDTPNNDQADGDGDGTGDACDSCPADTDNDLDGDGICGDLDNCPSTANTNQSDADRDGYGDACDAPSQPVLAGYSCLDLSNRSGIFPKLDTEGWTGILLVNLDNAAGEIVLTALDNNGRTVATENLTLAGHAKTVANPRNLFSVDISRATYLRYSSSVAIAGFQLNGSADDTMLDALPVLARSGPTLHFPHVAVSAIWESEVSIINASDSEMLTGELQAYDDGGNGVSQPLTINLPARGRTEIDVGGTGGFSDPESISHLVFTAQTGEAAGYVKFSTAGKYRAAVPAAPQANSGDIYIPHIASNDLWWTGIGLVNTNNVSATLTIQFDNGSQKTVTLPANGHRAFSIRSLFAGTAQPAINSGVIQNASGVIGLELFSGGDLLAGFLLSDDTSTRIPYAHIATGAVWWTGIAAYSPNASANTLTIRPYMEDGTPLTTQSLVIDAQGKYLGTAAQLGLPAGTAWFQIDSSSPMTGFQLFGQ